VADGGTVLVEVAPPAVLTQLVTVRLDGDGPVFTWARVGIDGLAALAEAADLAVRRTAVIGGRWFGWLAR
jgi:hypothetical protein